MCFGQVHEPSRRQAVGQPDVPGVESVHDLHVWVLTSGKNSLTAHVVHGEGIVAAELIPRLQVVLADRFKVFHTTLQLERTACEHSEDGCNFVDPRAPSAAAGAETTHTGHRH